MFQAIAVAAVAALAAGPVGPPPGYGSGTARPGETEPGVRLTLSYTADAGFASAVKLECDPAGGGHPQSASACDALETVGGDPAQIRPGADACMMIYAPIVAEMTGTWRGTTVTWLHRYGNSCEMRRATGVLFAF
jgi:hypothetical protein